MPWNILSPSPSSPRKNETMAKASLGLGLLELIMAEWELQRCHVVAVGSKVINAGKANGDLRRLCIGIFLFSCGHARARPCFGDTFFCGRAG